MAKKGGGGEGRDNNGPFWRFFLSLFRWNSKLRGHQRRRKISGVEPSFSIGTRSVASVPAFRSQHSFPTHFPFLTVACVLNDIRFDRRLW